MYINAAGETSLVSPAIVIAGEMLHPAVWPEICVYYRTSLISISSAYRFPVS